MVFHNGIFKMSPCCGNKQIYMLYESKNQIEKKLTEISAKIENELHKQRRDLLSTPLKNRSNNFDSNQMLWMLLTLIDTLKNTETQQSYVQILEGVSTNSIRQRRLDKIPAFGLLSSVSLQAHRYIFTRITKLSAAKKRKRIQPHSKRRNHPTSI